ncbi:FAD-dependent oxidoreductase [Streptomyces sp. NPDC054842]
MSDSSAPAASIRSAVVLGGSHAGMLAARALAEFADTVTVIERDALPDGPHPRKGLPQAQHVHLLWSGGAQAITELLPDTADLLLQAGGRRLAVPTHMVALSPQGWFRRWRESHHLLLSSRDLLDATIRAQVLTDERISLVPQAEALGLEGTAAAVTGVRVRAHDGTERVLAADLVVDATGRGSRAGEWLAALGLPAPDERKVDPGLVYASRTFRAPGTTAEHFPVVNVQADPRDGGPGKAGVLLPIEGGRWLVTLYSTRGGEPPTDNDDFRRFALEELRHPVIGELLEHAEALTDIVHTRTTANRRRYYEKAPRWPDGFTVIGDALAAFNPAYGHGLSVAAQSAVALRDVIRARGRAADGLARAIQKAVARPVNAAWDLAIGQDVFCPGAVDTPPGLKDRLGAAYVRRLLYTATGNGRIARKVTDVTSLEKGAHALLSPSVLIAAAVGPLKPQLSGPPLTTEELKAALS